MCQCWWGCGGCSKPVPLRDVLPFHRESNPACCNTRQTLEGLTATTSLSIIINFIHRYLSRVCSRSRLMLACLSFVPSQKARALQRLSSLTRRQRSFQYWVL